MVKDNETKEEEKRDIKFDELRKSEYLVGNEKKLNLPKLYLVLDRKHFR